MTDNALTLDGSRCRLRLYRSDDAPRLAELAGRFDVARWMTAEFRHPYGLNDAQIWIAKAAAERPVDNFAIEVDGLLAGGVGMRLHAGELCGVAEFGYWLGCMYWGRGIATDAAKMLAANAFAKRKLRRLEAHVFAPNVASARVLEKVGFTREAVLRAALVDRAGNVVDGLLYAKLHSDFA